MKISSILGDLLAGRISGSADAASWTDDPYAHPAISACPSASGPTSRLRIDLSRGVRNKALARLRRWTAPGVRTKFARRAAVKRWASGAHRPANLVGALMGRAAGLKDASVR